MANLDSAITLARQWQIPMTEAYALQYKGCAMLDQGRLDEAVRYLDEAEALARTTGFFDIREACHWAQALVARRRGDLQGALDQLNRGPGRGQRCAPAQLRLVRHPGRLLQPDPQDLRRVDRPALRIAHRRSGSRVR